MFKSGIAGSTLRLIESYLENRPQTVKIQNSISSELPVLSGVPQGSILGPPIFLVYMNDLTECTLSKKFGHADDFKFISENTLISHLDVRKIWNWCEKNFEGINLTKNKLYTLKGIGELGLYDYVFESTDYMKDLGLIVSSSLTWDDHAKKRDGKAFNSHFALKRNLSRTTLLNRKNAYVSYVVPIISYDSALWKSSKSNL